MRCAISTMLFLCLILAGVTGPAMAKRVALVIGNDNYVEVAKLHKAVNDARAMTDALSEIGFEVVSAEDVARREMNRQLQLFISRLQAGDEALFFYAGHGVEIAGRNYLLPTDIPSAKPGKEEFVKAEAIPVDRILDSIRSRGARVSILVLDACRNNPFPSEGTRSLGGSRGLARMPAAEGSFIMYSAGVGQTALDRLSDDDANPNSVFTRSLIPLLKQPGFSLTNTARQLRRDVQKLAATVSHDQRPAYYDEVTGDFFFSGDGQTVGRKPKPEPTPTVSAAAQAWSAVKDTTSTAVLEAFIKEFPDGAFTAFAKARLNELKTKNNSAALSAAAPKPATAHAYDGYWNVSVTSLTGCRNNAPRVFSMKIASGRIHEPQHKFPKKGTVSDDGKFRIKVTDRAGKLRAQQTGTISGAIGMGRFVGRKPSCKGAVTLKRLN